MYLLWKPKRKKLRNIIFLFDFLDKIEKKKVSSVGLLAISFVVMVTALGETLNILYKSLLVFRKMFITVNVPTICSLNVFL